MKAWQSLAVVATFVVAANAQAEGIQQFISSSHDSFDSYNYAEADVLFHPNDYTGFGLRGSYVVRDNVALTGRFDRLTADVANTDTTSTQISVGGRYFFALAALKNTDVDLTSYLTRAEAKGGGLSVSDTGFTLGARLRHTLGSKWIGNTVFTTEELYGGVHMGFSDGDANLAAHMGLILGVNELFSATAEIAHDDGTHFAIGVRMSLGKQQLNPDLPTKSALTRPPMAAPRAESAQLQAANPFALTADELADMDEIGG